VGKVRGAHLCPCLCGNIKWTSVDILPGDERKIAVDTVYYGPEDKPAPTLDADTLQRIRRGPKAVILKSDAPPLTLVEQSSISGGFAVTGYGYDADEEYWDSMRRRNGDWRAYCKGIWRAMTTGPPREDIPGSKALNEGDWARLRNTAEASDNMSKLVVEVTD
jgi:hypothetical protein